MKNCFFNTNTATWGNDVWFNAYHPKDDTPVFLNCYSSSSTGRVGYSSGDTSIDVTWLPSGTYIESDWFPEEEVSPSFNPQPILYVSQNGNNNDENNCQSEENPCATVEFAKEQGIAYLEPHLGTEISSYYMTVKIASGKSISADTSTIQAQKDLTETTLELSTTNIQNDKKNTKFVVGENYERLSSTSPIFTPNGGSMYMSYFSIVMKNAHHTLFQINSVNQQNSPVSPQNSVHLDNMYITSKFDNGINDISTLTSHLIVLQAGSFSMSSSTLENIKSSQAIFSVSPSSTITFTGNNYFSTITRTSGDGSIFSLSVSQNYALTLTGCQFMSCTAAANGAAIAATVTGEATLTISGGTFNNCQAQNGGAIFATLTGSGTLIITSGTYKNCKAIGTAYSQNDGFGGGIYIDATTSTQPQSVQFSSLILGTAAEQCVAKSDKGNNIYILCKDSSNFVKKDDPQLTSYVWGNLISQDDIQAETLTFYWLKDEGSEHPNDKDAQDYFFPWPTHTFYISPSFGQDEEGCGKWSAITHNHYPCQTVNFITEYLNNQNIILLEDFQYTEVHLSTQINRNFNLEGTLSANNALTSKATFETTTIDSEYEWGL